MSMNSVSLFVSFLFILFLFSVSFAIEPVPEFFINVTHISPQTDLVIPNTQNVFAIDIHCFKDSPRFAAGDIVDANTFVCFDTSCNQIGNFQFLFEYGCFVTKQYSYFIPVNTQSVNVRVDFKRFDEPSISYTKYAETKFDAYIPPATNLSAVPSQQKLSDFKIFGFLTLPIIALLLFVLGLVIVAFRRAFGLVFILIGVILFLISLFF